MLKRKPNRGQKSVNHRPRSVGPRELERNLEASVTPHPTAYQRMGALKRHRVASRELRFREKETGIRCADGKGGGRPLGQSSPEIEHHNHTTHTHYTKAKQRRESKRGSLLGASADQIGEAGSGKGEEAERRRRRRRGSKPFDEVGERGALRWVFIWCGWAERR